MTKQPAMPWRGRTLAGAAIVVCAWSVPQTGIAQETTAPSPMEILGQAPRYRVDEQGRLEPTASAPAARTPVPAATHVPPAHPPLSGTPYIPPAHARPAQTPVPGAAYVPPAPTPIPIATFAPPAPYEEKSPAYEVDDAPPPGLRPRQPEPTQRPGLIRGIMGKVPLVDKLPVIGPAITGKNRDGHAPPRDAEPNPDILPFPEPALEPPPAFVTPMSSEPLLYAPPAEDAGLAGTTASATAAPAFPTPAGALVAPPEAPPADAMPTPLPLRQPALADTPPAYPTPAPAAIQTPPLALPSPTAITLQTPTPVPNQVIVEPSTPSSGATTVGTPVATPWLTPVVTPPPVATAAVATTATLDQMDTAMPNPAVEPNELIRMEFENAVRKARAGDLAGAADTLRNYATNHSSSGLAPRALFLAIVFEPDPSRAVESYRKLRATYPDSRYLEEIVRRRLPVASAPEFTEQDVARLEQELATQTDSATRLETTRQLAAARVALKDYDRARQMIEAALPGAKGAPQEPALLDLLSECQLARRDMRGAMATLTDLLQRFPEYPNRPKVRLNMGLVSEEAGYYPSALANYRYLIEEAPDSPQATFAKERIRDLEALSE